MSYILREDYDTPMLGESPFFTEFFKNVSEECGLAQCDWSTEYDTLLERKEILIDMFNHYFWYREIGAETVHRFQHNLQLTLNKIQSKYDYAYRLYADMPVRIGGGYTEREYREYSSEGTSSSSSQSKFKDTPISGTINNPTSENSDTSEGESSGTGEQEITRERTNYEDAITKYAQRNIDYYKALDQAFIQEFEEDFMQLMMLLP